MPKVNIIEKKLVLELDLSIVEEKSIVITERLTVNGVTKNRKYPMLTDKTDDKEVYNVISDIIGGLAIEASKIIKL